MATEKTETIDAMVAGKHEDGREWCTATHSHDARFKMKGHCTNCKEKFVLSVPIEHESPRVGYGLRRAPLRCPNCNCWSVIG